MSFDKMIHEDNQRRQKQLRTEKTELEEKTRVFALNFYNEHRKVVHADPLINPLLEAINAGIEEISIDIDRLNLDDQGIEQQLKELEARMDELEAKVQKLEGKIKKLDSTNKVDKDVDSSSTLKILSRRNSRLPTDSKGNVIVDDEESFYDEESIFKIGTSEEVGAESSIEESRYKSSSHDTTQEERSEFRESIEDEDTMEEKRSSLRQALLDLGRSYENLYKKEYPNFFTRALMTMFQNIERRAEINFLAGLAKDNNCPDEVLYEAVQFLRAKIEEKERTQGSTSILWGILVKLSGDNTHIEEGGLHDYLEKHKKKHPMPKELESFYQESTDKHWGFH